MAGYRYSSAQPPHMILTESTHITPRLTLVVTHPIVPRVGRHGIIFACAASPGKCEEDIQVSLPPLPRLAFVGRLRCRPRWQRLLLH